MEKLNIRINLKDLRNEAHVRRDGTVVSASRLRKLKYTVNKGL
jgi:hypothetical protein